MKDLPLTAAQWDVLRDVVAREQFQVRRQTSFRVLERMGLVRKRTWDEQRASATLGPVEATEAGRAALAFHDGGSPMRSEER